MEAKFTLIKISHLQIIGDYLSSISYISGGDVLMSGLKLFMGEHAKGRPQSFYFRCAYMFNY